MIDSIDQTQRNAAKAVGFAYIVTSALAYFAEFHVRARLIDYQNAAKSLANIITRRTCSAGRSPPTYSRSRSMWSSSSAHT
ncbi:MAG: hypothetical protein ACREV7_11635 [Steroidobacteraceae bacterium]